MKKNIWILCDDRKGSVNQAMGIAEKLKNDFSVDEKDIVYNKMAALPNWIRRSTLLGVDLNKSSLLRDDTFPDAVISVSRRTLPIALWIKKKSGDKTKIIQLMYPGKFGIDKIDLLIVSEHDRGKAVGNNIFYIVGCPHRAFPEILDEAREKWTPVFSKLPRPWTVVILGGQIKNRPVSPENFELLAKRLLQLHEVVSGSILVTSSRRTGKQAEDIIMNKIKDIPSYTYLWGEKKDNPIMGFYACADRIVATGDSVSMVCESCGTGKPVMVFEGKGWLTQKHKRFVQSLYDGKYAINIDTPGALDFVPEKRLNPAFEIVDKIKEII